MLTISRETDYAARILLHLSLQPAGSRLTAQQIAAERLIPRALSRRVVTRLAAAGLITAVRGSQGGIRLARPARAITLLDVVEAMEGPLALNACVLEPQACPLAPACSAHGAWCTARQVLRDTLAQVTFERLALEHAAPA